MSEQSIILLVRADDIGSCHASNLGCIDVFRNGICRSVEIMAPCPWFPEAVTLLQANPQFDVGVHLTLTSEWDHYKWRPLSHAESLVTEDGYFHTRFTRRDGYADDVVFAECAWTPGDVEKEFRAQIELVRKHIPWISHLSNHMGYLRDDPHFRTILKDLATEYDLAVDLQDHGFERFRGFGDNNQTLSGADKTEALCMNLAALPPGRWLFVDHPAYDVPETRAIHHAGYENVAVDRQGVVDAWTDGEVLRIVEEREIQLVSYADVRSGRMG